MDCWQSITKQSFKDFEVIIVDDASTDNSVEVIKSIVKDNPRVTIYVNDRNNGCGFTKRKCVELSKGDLCGFLDPDDALTSNALKVMVDAHSLRQDCSIITSKYILVDMKMGFKSFGMNGEALPEGKSYLTYGKGALTAFATFKKTFYSRTEGIDAELKRAVDQDLYYKLEEVGDHLFINDFLYLYRITDKSISCNDNAHKAFYWNLIAHEKAYKRRRKNNMEIDNHTAREFKRLKIDHYVYRSRIAVKKKNYASKYYFLTRWFFLDPFYNWKLLVKSALLKNYS